MADADAPRVRRGKRNSSYTAIANALIDHPTLSPEARLTLIYLLSKPDDWQLQPGDIRRLLGTGESRCGRNKAYEVIKELKDTAYVAIVREIDAQGQFDGVTYYVFDEPNQDDPPGRVTSDPPRDGGSGDALSHDEEGPKPPCPEIRDTALSPCPLLRDPVKGDLTKDRKKQITEPPPPSPSVALDPPPSENSDFAELWDGWPAETRPRERPIAEAAFNRLSSADRIHAIDLAKSYLRAQAHRGGFAAMIPYLRNREFLEFADAPEFTSDGYFRILPNTEEWKAWMEHLSWTISEKTLASQERKGFLLVRTRLPQGLESSTGPDRKLNTRENRSASTKLLNGPQEPTLEAILSALSMKFSEVRLKDAQS